MGQIGAVRAIGCALVCRKPVMCGPYRGQLLPRFPSPIGAALAVNPANDPRSTAGTRKAIQSPVPQAALITAALMTIAHPSRSTDPTPWRHPVHPTPLDAGPLPAPFAKPTTPSAEDQARAGVCRLLGALLCAAPDATMLARLRGLPASVGGDAFAGAWEALRAAAGQFRPAQVADEFQRLFVGLGRGELLPYGSWYQRGVLMGLPLARLRGDLARLGFARAPGVVEPEDHVAALCEVAAALAQDAGIPIETERAFWQTHLASWVGSFWRDLEGAPSARFYRCVARLGAAFHRLEGRYLEMPS